LRSPYVGSETEHVLEFTECPVLVVPAPPAGERAG
jgi:nucleotide-binding universal stress UspA family protein